MTERERLTELIEQYTENITARDLHKADFDEKFADHLLANGIIVPPCKVGTKVYSIALGKMYEWDVASFTVDLGGISFLNVAFIEANHLYSVH